jgi:acetyltransferase
MDTPLQRADRIAVRPITPADQAHLTAFYAGLSDESRRTRFLGPCSGIGERLSSAFCAPDHAHNEGFVAVRGAGSDEQIVGHVCVEPEGSGTAEVAVAVAEDVRGRGVGRRLVEAAVDWARRDGLVALTATMLADNPAIQRLLTSLGLPCRARPVGAGVIEIRIELAAARSAA